MDTGCTARMTHRVLFTVFTMFLRQFHFIIHTNILIPQLIVSGLIGFRGALATLLVGLEIRQEPGP